MKRLACRAAPRRTLRFCGVLLAAIAFAAPFAFAGVNGWTTSAVQAIDRRFDPYYLEIPRASGSPAAVNWGKTAFVPSRDGNPEIYTINTDGT